VRRTLLPFGAVVGGCPATTATTKITLKAKTKIARVKIVKKIEMLFPKKLKYIYSKQQEQASNNNKQQ
jgi:hypothetical protein